MKQAIYRTIFETMSFSLAERRSTEQLMRGTVAACSALAVVVQRLYEHKTKKWFRVKDDASIFTIADGLVQALLPESILTTPRLRSVIGEEKSVVQLDRKPMLVDEFEVPSDIVPLVEQARRRLELADKTFLRDAPRDFSSLECFIDPIDGSCV